MKIIFLDIDGVLIPDFDHEKLDQEWNRSCVNNLMYIVNKTDAKIVISSSWRHNLGSLKKHWLKAGLDWGMIIGVTPSRTGGGRDKEIRQWLEWEDLHKTYVRCLYESDNVTDWITIDDEHYSLSWCDKQGKLVRTEIGTGLNKEKAEEAIKKLS